MTNHLKGPLLSELYSALSYAERVVFTASHITASMNLYEKRQCLALAFDFNNKLSDFLRLMVLRPQYGIHSVEIAQNTTSPQDILEHLQKSLQNIQSLFIALSHFSLNTDQLVRAVVECCNISYDCTRPLHEWCKDVGNVDIQYPRLNIVEIEDEILEDEQEVLEFDSDFEKFEEDHHDEFQDEVESPLLKKGPLNRDSIPRFHLPLEKMQNIVALGLTTITTLEAQRDRKYNKAMKDGHRAISLKKYPEAEEKFSEAVNIKETAEALTLLAWALALQNKDEKSKSLCLRAIHKDPSYGPPYNDLGALLFKAGEMEEALKWFELAKKAPHYQNREFPYINAGRVYLAKKKFHQALDEFGKALVLVPFNNELKGAIEKIKKQLDSSLTPDLAHSVIRDLMKDDKKNTDDNERPIQ